jgi:uncharacterized protein YndB with AHSA1/START domain
MTDPATGNRHGSAVVTLPNDTDIHVVRVFDAPAKLLFEANTTPELVQQWWGFDTSVWRVCEIDLRVGGTWRYVMEATNGFEVAFHGEYRDLVPNERIVTTEVYEGLPEDQQPEEDVVNIVSFTEADGRTTLTLLVQTPSKEVRDAIINSGMEGGMQEGMDLLEQVAISLR